MRQILSLLDFANVKKISKTATFRQSGVTFAGTILNGALSAVFYILAARILGPASFGLLIVAIAALTLIADIGDLGTDTGLVRFVGKFAKNDLTKVKRFLKLGLEVKVAVLLIVLLLGWLLVGFVHHLNIF